MSNVSDWSTNANDNDAAPPDGAPEGMARDKVNDVMREMMAAVARAWGDQAGALVSEGSSGAYTLTTNSASAALADSGLLTFVANHACPGASTLAVDGLAAKPLRSRLGEELAANAFLEDDTCVAVWNAEGEYYALIAPAPRFSLVEIATPAALIQPGGRLTLASNTPVLTTDQTSKTTVYYTPHRSNLMPLYDGTVWRAKALTELSQALSDTTKSPAAAVSGSVYDLFVWDDDDGTPQLSRGPAWSNATTRGTGAGTSELEFFGGEWVNKVAITNGPAARRGLYVGTIAPDSDGLSMDMQPAAAAGGASGRLLVWNMHNRIDLVALSRDSADSWAGPNSSWSPLHNSTNNRITFVRGMNDDTIEAVHHLLAIGANSTGRSGIGLDATDTLMAGCLTGITSGASQGTNYELLLASYQGFVAVGRHFIQALEGGDSTTTFLGDGGSPGSIQSGLRLRMKG